MHIGFFVNGNTQYFKYLDTQYTDNDGKLYQYSGMLGEYTLFEPYDPFTSFFLADKMHWGL